MTPLERDLIPRLRCLACGGVRHTPGDGCVRCDQCGRRLEIRDGVLYCPAQVEDTAVVLERAGMLDLEARAQGASGFTLEQLLASEDLQRLVLALPYAPAGADTGNPYLANVRGFAESFDFLMRWLTLEPGAVVLDVGADLTWSTARLAARGFRPIGIDINHHLVVAQRLGALATPYAVANVDMHAPAFRDGALDGITAFNALHHSARLPELCANLSRMLRPGGLLGMVEAYWYYQGTRDSFGKDEIDAGINENVYRLEEWHAALVGAGLELQVFSAGRSFDAVYRKSGAPGRRLELSEAVRELFDGFYRSRLHVPDDVVTVRRDTSTRVDVTIDNESRAAWSSDSQIPVFLSYHLASADGSGVATFDNARTALPGRLHPGSRNTVALTVDPLPAPGLYRVEVDLVHEGITWFADRGGRVAVLTLRVV
jgi:SAM-dependent methyltransferase